MGNSAPTGLRLGTGNGDRSCKVELGDSAAIHSDERVDYCGGVQRWGMSYKVGESTCTHYLLLDSTNHESMAIRIRPDPSCYLYCIRVYKAEASLLQVISSKALRSSFSSLDKERTYFTSNARGGGITETCFELYESGTSRGLVVCEWKKKTSVEEPYEGAVTHYYANSKNGRDIGLSVAVKRIRVKDGRFEFVVDGPHQHPVHALLYMFEEVRRTGIWKLTYCPHCANSVIQMHHISGRSDTEDSDVDYVPSAPLRGGRRQSLGGLLSNYGSNFRGDHNGKVEIQNYYARGR